MYNLPYFKADNYNEVLSFCDEHNNPVATHVPVLIEERDEKIFLHAHIMRKQKHTIAFEQNKNVMAIFSGAHTYVSASWYEQKGIASTWNYQAVHAQGILNFKDDIFLHALLTKLTEKFENNAHSPALVKHMEEEYVQRLMKSIVAFEIEITSIEHVFKLSQNRDEKSYENIIEHLKDGDEDAQTIAVTMKENQHKVFPE